MKSKKVITFWIVAISMKQFWTVNMNTNISELTMSLAHNFPSILFTEITKIPYFSFEKVRFALYLLWINAKQCLLRCILIWGHAFAYLSKREKIQYWTYIYTKYVENSEARISSTHSFAYSYRLWNCILSYLPYLYLIFKKFFTVPFKNCYSFYCINLNLD